MTFRIHMGGNYLCKLMRKHLAKLKGEHATPLEVKIAYALQKIFCITRKKGAMLNMKEDKVAKF